MVSGQPTDVRWTPREFIQARAPAAETAPQQGEKRKVMASAVAERRQLTFWPAAKDQRAAFHAETRVGADGCAEHDDRTGDHARGRIGAGIPLDDDHAAPHAIADAV